jgi:hypothetical protein
MFTYQDRDVPKMPTPGKIHLPILPESVLEEMNDEFMDAKGDPIDTTLLKLPASSLKGTFAKAYKILTEITAQIGWDTLLKCRSSVFVMEEEYREEKKHNNASVTAIHGESPRQSTEDVEQSNGTHTPEEKKETNGDAEEENKNEGDEIEKPATSVAPEEKDEESSDSDKKPAEKYTHFQNKRLCERWLDNLFMVLYEVRLPVHLFTLLILQGLRDSGYCPQLVI